MLVDHQKNAHCHGKSEGWLEMKEKGIVHSAALEYNKNYCDEYQI